VRPAAAVTCSTTLSPVTTAVAVNSVGIARRNDLAARAFSPAGGRPFDWACATPWRAGQDASAAQASLEIWPVFTARPEPAGWLVRPRESTH